jgi:hypothetical protein
VYIVDVQVPVQTCSLRQFILHSLIFTCGFKSSFRSSKTALSHTQTASVSHCRFILALQCLSKTPQGLCTHSSAHIADYAGSFSYASVRRYVFVKFFFVLFCFVDHLDIIV